jgi:hypothetical protein
MPDNKKNMFSHPSIARPSPLEQNERLSRLAEVANEQPQYESPAQEAQTQDIMAPGDLEQLIFLGCIEDSKDIAGYKFDMRTLTAKEQNDVWISVSFLNNDTKFFIIKVAFLARAIRAVNGRDLEVLYRNKDYKEITREQRCIRVIEAWQQPLIDELYDFYSDLVERSRKTIRPDSIKKS